MKRSIKNIIIGLKSLPNLSDIKKYIMDLKSFYKNTRIKIILRPIFKDYRVDNGDLDPHYFLQDFIVAKDIFMEEIDKVIDVGSRVDGFISKLALFTKVEMLDIRPSLIPLENVSSIQVDFMQRNIILPTSKCVTSLHTVEHVGLGRYGDPVNPNGREKFISNLSRMTERGGLLYLSAPVSQDERVEFNAHYVSSPDFYEEKLLEDYDIIRKWLIEDNGRLIDAQTFSNTKIAYGLCIWKCRKKLV